MEATSSETAKECSADKSVTATTATKLEGTKDDVPTSTILPEGGTSSNSDSAKLTLKNDASTISGLVQGHLNSRPQASESIQQALNKLMEASNEEPLFEERDWDVDHFTTGSVQRMATR